MPPELARLLLLIEDKLGWGPASGWQTKDFDLLQENLFEKTGVSLSNSTLRRVWGRVNYDHMPSMATLNALSVYAGFDSWRGFLVVDQQAQSAVPAISATVPIAAKTNRGWIPKLLLLVLIISVIVYLSISIRHEAIPTHKEFNLSSRRITDNIPNSVVFTYDATNAITDSVFFQQSWDDRTRIAVPKVRHTFTSLYYEPGFFRAKLLIGSEVVKEDTVMIPTRGWAGLIRQFQVPLYLERSEFMKADKLELTATDLEKKGLSAQSPLPFTIYANVGNMERVPVNDFSFHADVRNGYKKGTGVCQRSFVVLLTDGEPIVIPLSDPGCISDLKLIACDSVISGKLADLSRFGTDMTSWVSVDCSSSSAGLDFFVNGTKAYTVHLSRSNSKILGLLFMFRGTGSVKNIGLASRSKPVFSAFR